LNVLLMRLFLELFVCTIIRLSWRMQPGRKELTLRVFVSCARGGYMIDFLFDSDDISALPGRIRSVPPVI
jgi:hypothetical protein